MGRTNRPDSIYVQFKVIDDGEVLRLAEDGCGRLKRWIVGCHNQTIAKQHEAIIKAKLLAGSMPSPSKSRAQSMTFRRWAKEYLGLDEVKRLASYEIKKLYVRNLVDYFGDKPLGAITPHDVYEYRQQRVVFKRVKCPECRRVVACAVCRQCGWKRTDQGRPASIQTVNHDHGALVTMFYVAMGPRYRLVSTNPAAEVEQPDPKNKRDRVLSADEWEKLKAALPSHLRPLLIVAHDVGPRRGELLKLEWADVDMRRKEFTLRKTKNDDARTVPMTDEVYRVFLDLWQNRRPDTNRVFLYKGKPFDRPGRAYHTACKRAGLTNVRIHDFRHTATTNFRRAGVETHTVMEIVGHKSAEMFRRYDKISPDDKRRAIEKIERFKADTLMTPSPARVESESISTRQTE